MSEAQGLLRSQAIGKRTFDIALSVTGLILAGWIVILLIPLVRYSTRGSGIFSQSRVGLGGRLFRLYKLRTMTIGTSADTTVTRQSDPRITPLGRILRRSKLDELPQLYNVLTGDMSFVGPRPDVAGFADKLVGSDRRMLAIRPGITGPATLLFRNEERLLDGVENPELFNAEVIYPLKVRINCEYIDSYSFAKDIGYILQSLFGWPKLVDDSLARQLAMPSVDTRNQ